MDDGDSHSAGRLQAVILQPEQLQRTANELVHHPFVLHELEHLSELRIFGARSLDDRDVVIFLVPKDISCACHDWVILLVEVRPVHRELV